MDDTSALLARTVAQAASAWLRVPQDTTAYRRLIAAVAAWDAYVSPALENPASGQRDLFGTGPRSAGDGNPAPGHDSHDSHATAEPAASEDDVQPLSGAVTDLADQLRHEYRVSL